MPERPLEVVRACFEAWRAGDFERSLSYYADDVTWKTGSVDSTVYRGREGVVRAMEEWTGAFDDYWAEVDDLLEHGDRVVLLFREGGLGRASGVRVEEEGAFVFTVRDGLIASGRAYVDRAEGLRAAGLETL